MTDYQGKSPVAQRFDKAGARQYDGRIVTVVPGYEVLHEMAGSLLQHRLGQRARLLVVGSGTGTEIVRLGEHNPGWNFVGVDSSPDMVRTCRERLAEIGLSERVELHVGLLQNLHTSPLYDAATSILVTHFLPGDREKLALLRSVSQRLKSGAPFVLVDMHGDRTSRQFTNLLNAWKQWQLMSGISEGDVEERLQHTMANIHFVSEQRIHRLLIEAGFEDIQRFYGALLFGGWVARKAPAKLSGEANEWYA